MFSAITSITRIEQRYQLIVFKAVLPIDVVFQVYGELEGVVEKLSKEAQRGTLPRKTFPKPLPIANHHSNSNLSNSHVITNGNNL